MLWGRHEGARGGRLLPGCVVSGVGRSPTPDCPPSGRAAGAHYPLAVGAGGCGRGDPSPTRQRALFRAGFARCGGGTRELGGGGASCLGVGRPVWGALQPPTARPLGGLLGPTTYSLWVQGCAGVGTRQQPHSARSFELALRAVGAARGARGGAPPAWVWGVRGRALSHPRLPPLWAGCRGPLPTGCGCGGVQAWEPVTNPTARALASWLCALWGRHEGCPGGAPLAWVWGVRCGALFHPRPPALWAGCRGPLPTGCGCGGVRAWRPVTNPTARALSSWLCALWGRHEGARGGGRLLPGCGASGVGRSPTPDCLPSGLPGPTTHWLWVRGGAGVGTCHQPHSARSCKLALRAKGAAGGRAGGGRLLPGCGASGVGRSPTPDCTPSGRAAGAHYPLAVGAWGCGRADPSPTPQRALFRAGFARCGGGTRAPGGGRLLPGCGASGVRRSPIPECPPSGRAAGAHYPLAVGAGGSGRGDLSPTPQRALFRAGFARCGGGTRAPGGGGASFLGAGRPGSGALPPPTACPLGCRGPLPTGCGCGGVQAWGPVTNPTARALASWLCALRGRHEGARGGAPPAWVWGVRGRALSHPRLHALWAGCWGPLPTGCGCVGVRAWGPVTNPTARALSSWLCALWGRHEGARGGAPPAWVWGVRGQALSHTRLPALWAGCRGPLPTGCGCGGVLAWGPVTNATARALASWLCALWGRHEGARGGRLLPGCGASGVRRSPTPDCPPFARAAGLLCVCVPCLAGSGGPASWARFGAPHLSFGLSCFALRLFGPLRAGVALFVVVVGFLFFLLLFPFFPLAAPPLCPALRVFRPRVPWALASCPPPPFFFPPPPLCALLSPALRVFRLGVPRALASCCPPPSFFFVFFAPPPPCCLWRFFLSGCLWPLRPPPFFFLSCCFFSCCASAVCVLGCRAVCSLSCPFVVLCASSVLFLVAGVVGSWCRCLLLGVCWWLRWPGVVVWWCVSALVPVSGLAVAGRPPCGVPFPCAVSCGAVLPCGAVLWCPVFFFFVFLPAGGAGFLLFPVGCGLWAGSGSFLFPCSTCAVLCWCACAVALCSVLSCPRGAGWCCVLLPVVLVCLRSTRPSGTKPCTTRAPKTHYATLDSK